MIKKLMANILIYTIFTATSLNSYAITLSLKSGNRNLRTQNGLGELKFLKSISKGSKITIPDAFIDKHFKGDKRDEVSILRWLSSAENLPLKQYKNGSKTSFDYFVPIKVVGSSDKGWISLRTLARDKGLLLHTKETTSLFKREKQETVKKHNMNECPDCTHKQKIKSAKNARPSIPKETLGLIAQVANKLDRSANEDTKNRGQTRHIINNFNKTCSPTKFSDYIKSVKGIAKKYKIPVDLLLGIMTQESAGRCDRSNKEFNGTYSAGLFQINTSSIKTKGVRKCGNTNRAKISKYCLENPYVSLHQAAKILSAKYKSVNGSRPQSSNTKFSTLSLRKKDLWRKAIAAYNGGEGWVIKAYHAIKAFNKRYNENLDPHNWHVRKIFMLRNVIKSKGGKLLGSDYRTKERSNDNTLSNLTYVEAITNSRMRADQTSKWSRYTN